MSYLFKNKISKSKAGYHDWLSSCSKAGKALKCATQPMLNSSIAAKYKIFPIDNNTGLAQGR
jgi:hypothetical protein